MSHITWRNSVVLVIHFTNKNLHMYLSHLMWTIRSIITVSSCALTITTHVSPDNRDHYIMLHLSKNHHDPPGQNLIAQLHATPCFEVTTSNKSWDTTPYLTRTISHTIDLLINLTCTRSPRSSVDSSLICTDLLQTVELAWFASTLSLIHIWRCRRRG